ncbi:LytR/AlgR family response regulator transcription factor [Enterococcus sp. LJL99]
MKKIYLCDDELIYREQINSIIKHAIDHYDHPLMIELKAKNSEELLAASIDHSSSIYFLDVNLIGSKLNGFELGKEIRRRDPRGFIIFITTFEELAFETFKYRLEAMDYIVKDQPEKITERIASCLASIMERELANPDLTNEEELLVVKFGDEIIRLSVSEIIFIETSNRSHMVIIHTKTQTLEIVDNLQKLEEVLSTGFIRSHRSFLVNQAYITRYNLKQNILELTTGQSCLVSRRMKKILKETLTCF